jgi:hypothetical protein
MIGGMLLTIKKEKDDKVVVGIEYIYVDKKDLK